MALLTYVRYGNIAIVNQNILEFITNIAIEKGIDIYTFQESKAGGIEKELDVHGYTFFLYAEEGDRRSGVGNMLAPKARMAWERSGSPEPIRKFCAEGSRIIAVNLCYKDPRNNIIQLCVMSVHMPHNANAPNKNSKM